MTGEIYKISISTKKGKKKRNTYKARLEENFGIVHDAHAGTERQVSLLAFESFDKIRTRLPEIKPGEFAENITTRGLNLEQAEVGRNLLAGDHVVLVITEVGKECHEGCYIKKEVGDCIMPREGVFARVARGGMIKEGDPIKWI